MNIAEKVSDFVEGSKRVLLVSKKPSRKEFMAMLTVTGIGILVIAAIAYVIHLFFQLTGIGF